MKKLFVFASAILMAAMVRADVNINLNDFKIEGDEDYTEAIVNGDVLTCTYELGEWAAAGVKFDLDNLEGVTSIVFDVKGHAYSGTGADPQWIAFVAYLKDSEGIRWQNEAADLHISGEDGLEWQHIEVMPDVELWTADAQHKCGEKPFIELGFMANPMYMETSGFDLKNVVVKVGGTGLNEMKAAKAGAKRMIKNGRFMIQLQNGRHISALGADL